MGIDDGSKKDENAINESVELYKKVILDDINLKLRVINKEKTYITKLIDWPGERFIFAAPLDKLDWVLFEKDKVVQIAFVTRTAIFIAKVQILNRYRKNDMLFYSAVLLEPLVKQQQRQYFRVDVLLESSFKCLPEECKDCVIEEIPSNKGTIVNISIGGLCLVSTRQLNKGEKIILYFRFMNTSFELLGEILFQGEKNAVGNYMHRVKFIKLENNIKNMLNKLIFEKQRLIMSKNKETLT
ncbi:flagellar brake protein [Cellulosilyticum sp. I15G10I2]|uniref:flagellar brake protein n=1 Tax=Cellulosilyticum sp. I15G10I2 TaxID=1892843 RepID=UPI00085C30A5|nr:flagellar brake domain-containing protein [Cellulosilyticum sp. I15G10I2]